MCSLVVSIPLTLISTLLCVRPQEQKKKINVYTNSNMPFVDVLLTVHLSIFILVVNQLDAQNLFYNKFISCLYMFQAPCAHRQEVKIYYTASSIIISVGGRPVHLCTGRPPIGVMIPEAV